MPCSPPLYIPAALEQQSRLVDTLSGLKSVGVVAGTRGITTELEKVASLFDALSDGAATLEAAVASGDSVRMIAEMNAVRVTVDALETVVDDTLWPVAKYRELLFVI